MTARTFALCVLLIASIAGLTALLFMVTLTVAASHSRYSRQVTYPPSVTIQQPTTGQIFTTTHQPALRVQGRAQPGTVAASVAAVSVTLETLKTIKDESETFVGMKHAVNDLGFVSECLNEFGPEFKVFVGLEELSFPMMAIGACGLMNAVGNLRPDTLAEMCEKVWANDLTGARKLHELLLEINQAVFYDTNPIPIKYMMKRLGLLETNEHRLPMVPATPELERRLDAVLERAAMTEMA